MKIFISGKITGEPVEACVNKFAEAELSMYCRTEVDDVVNPLNLQGIHFGISHEEAMRLCISALDDCDAICMLPDWTKSRDASMEFEHATRTGKKVLFYGASVGMDDYELV
ncbi:MAG TPA: DUF4406 domain-containing protein [Candidatus Woesebacteria bacterium]|nr:DUF4406 domain-containing protein [Candidatus Woesebacteria bacterium]